MVNSNVISVCNARKRDYGDNHWLWAVWIDVDHKSRLSDQEPCARGLCGSKCAARNAAWNALNQHVASKEDRSAHYNGWAFDLLWREKEADTRPCFSRCLIGRDRWQWVVGDFDEITASGIAESPEAAQRAAELQLGSVRLIGNGMAKRFRRKQVAIERSQRTTDCDTTSTIELVYECHRYDGDFGSSDTITPHRIVKRSKTRIYVDVEPYREQSTLSGTWTDYVQQTFVLDRVEFESTGKARRSGDWWRNEFYASPDIYFAERRSAPRPECFVVLGIEATATEAEVKGAFKRLARTVHPDAGGDAEEFKAVYSAYERAMSMVSSNA